MSNSRRSGDWFKMYPILLNDPALAYVLKEEPYALGVWVWILSRCCVKRSDEVKLSNPDRLGAVTQLNISLDAFDKSLGLLQEAEYISVSDGVVKVPKWNDLQSDYCRQLAKSEQTPRNSEKVSLEEKREDKKRINKKFSPPSVAEVRAYCVENGLLNVDAEQFVAFYDSKDWMIGKNKMKRWKSAVAGWNSRNGKAEQSAKTRQQLMDEWQARR